MFKKKLTKYYIFYINDECELHFNDGLFSFHTNKADWKIDRLLFGCVRSESTRRAPGVIRQPAFAAVLPVIKEQDRASAIFVW